MTCIHYKETLTALRGVRLSTRSCAMGILSSNLPEHCEHCSMRTENAYVRCPICDRTLPSGVDMSYDGDWAMCKDCAKRLKGERMTFDETTVMTLYEVLLVDGTRIISDESPYDLKTEWVDLRTYSLLNRPKAKDDLYMRWKVINIRPSMIVGFTMKEDCKVSE